MMTADLDAVDFFCGMGGSSSGLVKAGFTVKLAANHWARAIETHSANHPTTEHLCADLTGVDLRYLPRTRTLWASPICTEVSPAGGRRRRALQGDLFEEHGHVPAAAFERTRATFTGAGRHHGLVIPFRRGSAPYKAKDAPLSTMATRDQHGVMRPAVTVEDCLFRMLAPREAANAQAFDRSYIMHGNLGEQQMQAGNAVAVNVAQWIGSRVAEGLAS